MAVASRPRVLHPKNLNLLTACSNFIMHPIATLTVNPAIDKNTSVELVVAEEKLRCERASREPGGGGVNVSRAIQRLGGQSTAVYTAGGFTGDILKTLLSEEELEHHPVSTEDWTRENLIVYEERSGRQFRFGMPGSRIAESEWQRSLDVLRETDDPPEYIVASGSLGEDMPSDFYSKVGRLAGEIGTRFVLDTSRDALRDGLDAGAYLIKPNLRELQQLAGEELDSEREQEHAARQIIQDGRSEVVVISLGAAGVLLVTADGSEHFRAPTVPIRSKVGAGDSTVAGIVLGLHRGLDLREAVLFGVAAGAAAVMTPGTELCRRDDTERLFEDLNR